MGCRGEGEGSEREWKAGTINMYQDVRLLEIKTMRLWNFLVSLTLRLCAVDLVECPLKLRCVQTAREDQRHE